MQEDLTGRIVRSKAGRDKGRRFVVVGCADEAHVLIADGSLRKAGKPKRKKLMHLSFESAVVEGLDAELNAHGATADAFIRKALKETCQHHDADD